MRVDIFRRIDRSPPPHHLTTERTTTRGIERTKETGAVAEERARDAKRIATTRSTTSYSNTRTRRAVAD
jgi:hypothetical protein